MYRVLVATMALMLTVASSHGQDRIKGEKDFLICRACHQIGPGAEIAVGPVLNGVVGRKAGTYPGYNYSAANKESGIVWTPEALAKYLANPQAVVPHTKMLFPGVKDEQRRKDIIAYLQQFNDDGTKKN